MTVITFDLDGTLISCRNRQVALFEVLARKRGIGLELSEFWNLKRHGHSTLSAACYLGFEKNIAVELSKDWIALVETPYWLSLDTVFDDVRKVLWFLRQIGYRITVLTARQNRYWLTVQLNNTGLTQTIDELHIVNPTAAVAMKAQYLQLVKPSLFVGDSESDFRAAQVAGIRFCAVTRGQRDGRFLESHGATELYGDIGWMLGRTSAKSETCHDAQVETSTSKGLCELQRINN
jgi:phosphoglycolate phosphatase-like HAD superfamily hydrolase